MRKTMVTTNESAASAEAAVTGNVYMHISGTAVNCFTDVGQIYTEIGDLVQSAQKTC